MTVHTRTVINEINMTANWTVNVIIGLTFSVATTETNEECKFFKFEGTKIQWNMVNYMLLEQIFKLETFKIKCNQYSSITKKKKKKNVINL
jgi:hypothetical protein